MPSGRLLRQLIKSGSQGDVDGFRKFSEEVIREEREKQHHLLATDLEQILYGGPRAVGHLRKARPDIPVDKETGAPLLRIMQPTRTMDDIVLRVDLKNAVDDLLLEYRRCDVLHAYGLRPASKILLWGAPGTGKTLLAEVIASELERDLAVVRLDSLVSSLLGETATNIRKVFEFLDQASTVTLFDEFDALGKERSSENDHGELKRVVNAVLQMFDSYIGRSLIVSATNHAAILDTAIWRRFDEVFELDMPSVQSIAIFLEKKLGAVRTQFSIEDSSGLFEGRSFADVERILRRAIKKMVLQNKKYLELGDIRRAINVDQGVVT